MSKKAVSGFGAKINISREALDENILEGLISYDLSIEGIQWKILLNYLYIYSNKAQQILEQQALDKSFPLVNVTLTTPDGTKYFGRGRAREVHIESPSEDAIKVFADFGGLEGLLKIS